jgi:hypothetical protein
MLAYHLCRQGRPAHARQHDIRQHQVNGMCGTMPVQHPFDRRDLPDDEAVAPDQRQRDREKYHDEQLGRTRDREDLSRDAANGIKWRRTSVFENYSSSIPSGSSTVA